jgi:CHAT domain-containing protein
MPWPALTQACCLTYWLTGPGLISNHDVAAVLSKLLGRTVTYRELTSEENKDAISRGAVSSGSPGLWAGPGPPPVSGQRCLHRPARIAGHARDEVAAVRTRLGSGIRDHGVVERLDSLITLLDDPPNVLHFSCHNRFTDQRGSVITLDGGPLRPSDLAVAVQKRAMAPACPLVFFNACRTAGEIPGLMQMMGWAKQFMGAGAGAFLGSLWAVRSSSARTFADAFYRALVTERAPLGVAPLRARQSHRR